MDAEYVGVKPEEIVFGTGVTIHPYKGLKLIANPMIAFTKLSNKEHHYSGTETTTLSYESSAAMRFGIGYDFHLKNISIGPVINFDFGKPNDINYGVLLGYGF